MAEDQVIEVAGAFSGLNPRERRRIIRRTLLRSAAMAVLLFVAYFVLPLDGRLDGLGGLLLVLALGGIVVLGIRQVRAIIRARFPQLRAVEALAVLAPLQLLIFATSYYLMSQTEGANLSQQLTRVDALYFAMTVFATVGFGDITAVTQVARIVVTIQMAFGLLVLGLGVHTILSAVDIGRHRQGRA